MRDGDVTLRAREYLREPKGRTKTISSIKRQRRLVMPNSAQDV